MGRDGPSYWNVKKFPSTVSAPTAEKGSCTLIQLYAAESDQGASVDSHARWVIQRRVDVLAFDVFKFKMDQGTVDEDMLQVVRAFCENEVTSAIGPKRVAFNVCDGNTYINIKAIPTSSGRMAATFTEAPNVVFHSIEQ